MSHGLSAETVSAIHGVLARFPDIEKAVLYGSRAKGNYRKGSDIDLTLLGAQLDWDRLSEIRLALDDLPLPYKFDVSMFSHLKHAGLIEHIERVGIPIYERDTVATG